MNGFKLLEVAKRNPKNWEIRGIGKGKTNLVRSTGAGTRTTTIDNNTGEILGTMYRMSDRPITFHYGRLNGQPVCDCYTGGFFGTANCTRYKYNTLDQLKDIVVKTYESVKDRTGSMIM